MKKIFYFILLINFLTTSLFAQQGKDGTPSITTTTIVNIYTPLTANAAVGTNTISVLSVTGFSPGDLIYIIQMQGATVKANIYQFNNQNNALPNDTSFGKITAYNGAGNNEFAEITSVSSSGNIITLDCALKDSFGVNGRTQVIRVPRYTSLNLTGSALITCPLWNGSIGGVAVIEVQGNTTIAAANIDVSGKGFRGGSVLNASGTGATNTGSNYGSPSANNGAHKGESIAGDTNVYNQNHSLVFSSTTFSTTSTPLTICKGNVANGGGGGDANNCGGGGGSNGGIISNWNGMGNPDNTTANNISAWAQESTTPVNGSFRPTASSGGGRGGYAFSGNNADPTTNGPNNSGVWAGDTRHNDGGWGGIPLDYTTGKLFLGGGGGAGDSNDKNGTAGANGGGLFYLLSYGTVSGTGQILANGSAALNTNTNTGAGLVGDDGAGGGGGGGTVIVNSIGNISLTNALPISAQGGKGGDYHFHGITTTQNFGPGGGGGGGYISTTNAITGANVNGGANGIAVGNTTKIVTKFPPNGASAGGTGSIATFSTSLFSLAATNYTTCTSSASLSVTVNGNAPSGLSVMWYTTATGGASVYTGNPYVFTAPSTAGTYTYYAGTCPGTYRIPVILTVNTGSPILTINATNTTICSGTSITLTVSGTTSSYTWSANAGSATTNTVSVSPTGNTTYSVTGVSTGACAGTATASINITVTSPPTITVTASSNTLCAGSTVTLTANSSIASYTWSANAGSATTNTVAVSPATGSTTYTVTSGSGTCISTQTITINVIATPTVTVLPANAYICKGSSSVLIANGATSGYSWSTGATTNSVSVSPSNNTTYTVTGFNATCPATKTVLVKVDGGIIKADSISNAASCGNTNGSYVLNSVTGGISPYQINFNNGGYTAIPAFSYTVPNLSGNTYTVNIKDSLGCVYSTSVTIGNTSGITSVDSTVLDAKCAPSASGTITINSVTGGSSPYQIKINNGTYAPITSFPVSYPNLTAGTYTISVEDAANCPHVSLITVGTVTGITSFTLNPITPDTCNKHVGSITASNVTGGTSPYQYNLNGGTNQSVATFSSLPAGLYTVTVTDNNGCSLAQADSVKDAGSATTPSITATSTTTCQGGSIILTSSSAASYTWSTGANTQTITVTSGNTTYSIATTSANGCSAISDTVRIVIKPNPATPLVNDTAITECQNSIQAIHLNSTGLLIIHNTAGQLQPLPFTPNIPGTSVYTAYDSLNGCISSVKTITVTISTAPTTAPLVTSPVQYCIGTPATSLTATTTAGNATLIWEDGSHNVINTPPNPTPTTNNLGTTTYYVYQAIGSCIGSSFDSIKVNVIGKPNPNFTATPATDIAVGENISFAPVQTSTANTYYWNFEDANTTMDTSTKALPKYTYTAAATYCPKLIVANALGCKDSTTICLDIVANISMVIPNIFTPNGDGINDVFSLKTSGFTNLTCDIFDRWGLKLYTFNNPAGYWDGSKAVDGTYFYVIQSTDVKGEAHKYNGFVQLIK